MSDPLKYESTYKFPVLWHKRHNTVIGSTAAVVAALGVAVASTAPIAAVVMTGGGAMIAAGALYRKLTQEQKNDEKP
jgi:hypothetical protein